MNDFRMPAALAVLLLLGIVAGLYYRASKAKSPLARVGAGAGAVGALIIVIAAWMGTADLVSLSAGLAFIGLGIALEILAFVKRDRRDASTRA